MLDGHAISGTLEDLSRLASIVDERLATGTAGHSFTVGDEYAPRSPYDLVIEIAPDGFDPAAADPCCVDPHPS